jgi:hypothetical protein
VCQGEGHSCRVFVWCERGEVRPVGGAGSPVGSGWVWDRYGSLTGVGLSDRQIRDADGTATSLGVLANAWKGTVRDAVGDIRAHREAAKAEVRRRVGRGLVPEAERKRLYTLLKRDQWTGDPLERRWMRGQWRRGHNHTSNQIIIRSDNVRTVTLTEGGEVWLAMPGLAPGAGVVVAPATAVAPAGTLRVVLRGGRDLRAALGVAHQRQCG